MSDYTRVYTILIYSIGECYYSCMFSGISHGIYYIFGLTTLTLNEVVKHRYIILLLSMSLLHNCVFIVVTNMQVHLHNMRKGLQLHNM